ncbi:DUF1850 domain-containing protein [Alteribacter natronophilus]|uniref:DUF1850 domain-containing protein n=1 Tax=Alteribacter natronophilus TaxID=2583810 RepID=UPI00110EF061|nr:DUF1850 domain-containing protein [Alteribacter natronophilus]TMW72334.1 DUF1850 domain-containing protein [Alteribacter natronophilus]
MKRLLTSLLLVAVTASGAAAFLYAISPEQVLEIEKVESNKVLWQAPIEPEVWFHHEYIHSVEKSKVMEKYKLASDGQLYAMESWTRSFGAGLPYEDRGTAEIVDGWYILKDLYSPLEELRMLPSHLHLHTFHYGDEELVLSDPPFKRTHIRIHVSRLSAFERITWLFTRP